MADKKGRGSKVRVFMGRNRRLITLVAAVVGFLMYLAKEGAREHFKDLGSTVDSAENLFIVTESRSPAPDLFRELSGISKKDVDHARDIMGRLFEKEEEYIRGSLNSTKRLLVRLPGQEERFKNVEKMEIKFFDETSTMISEKTQALDREVIEEDRKNKIAEQVKLQQLMLSHLTKIVGMDSDVRKVADEVESIAEQMRVNAEDRYERWNLVFWILFIVGQRNRSFFATTRRGCG